jgi:hypothetical protein
MARKTREQFARIIEREFLKTAEIQATASVVVDMSEDEVIRVLYATRFIRAIATMTKSLSSCRIVMSSRSSFPPITWRIDYTISGLSQSGAAGEIIEPHAHPKFSRTCGIFTDISARSILID